MPSGSGTGRPVTPASTQRPCLEYLSVDDVRAEFGDDVAEMTDAQIQRRIDRLTASLEDVLGHTFGRAMIARSTEAHTVAVSATALVFGSDSFAFADYPTLWDLEQAVNDAGEAYSLEILSGINTSTPSTLLKSFSATSCGPDYEDRVVLCASALYLKVSGDGTSHVWLPLPLASVSSVIENGTTLETTAYWATPGDVWLVRKLCGCAMSGCRHPKGRWSNAYPGNIEVTYIPRFWGRVPVALKNPMLDAFKLEDSMGAVESESFGEYSYRRAARTMTTPWDALTSGAVRSYTMSFHP